MGLCRLTITTGVKDKVRTPHSINGVHFITSIINAKEERDTSYVDIPGVFLQTDTSNGTIIKSQGKTDDTLLQINPTFKKYVVYICKKYIPNIYIEAIKEIYGTVCALKPFFKIYQTSSLINWVLNRIYMMPA